MGTRYSARSISRPVAHAGRFVARVLATFDHTCDLATDANEVIALVTLEVGNGPLNIVVDAPPGVWAGIETGQPVQLQGDLLNLAHITIALDGAPLWEPRPDWASLSTHQRQIRANIEHLAGWLGRHPRPSQGLIALLCPQPAPSPTETALLAVARQAVSQLGAALVSQDSAQVGKAAAGLVGLGSGLTPAGDDFLIGVMAWLWLNLQSPMCAIITQAAAGKTTLLSSALLRAAARGEFSQPWHDLLNALTLDNPDNVERAAQQVLCYGHTSGADALAGFIVAASS